MNIFSLATFISSWSAARSFSNEFNTRKSGVDLETFATLRVCVFVYACVFSVLDGEIIFVKICNGACVAGSTGSTEFVSTS